MGPKFKNEIYYVSYNHPKSNFVKYLKIILNVKSSPIRMHFSPCGVMSILEVADLGASFYSFVLGLLHCTYLNRNNELEDNLRFVLES